MGALLFDVLSSPLPSSVAASLVLVAPLRRLFAIRNSLLQSVHYEQADWTSDRRELFLFLLHFSSILFMRSIIDRVTPSAMFGRIKRVYIEDILPLQFQVCPSFVNEVYF